MGGQLKERLKRGRKPVKEEAKVVWEAKGEAEALWEAEAGWKAS